MALSAKAPTSFVVNLAREEDVLTFQQLGEQALHKAITIADETAEVHAKSQLLRAHGAFKVAIAVVGDKMKPKAASDFRS